MSQYHQNGRKSISYADYDVGRPSNCNASHLPPFLDSTVAATFCVLVFVRLAGDNRPPNGGRLEVNYNIWGTVCNHYFDNRAADVACFELGFR